ncbi:hypothetical protein GCM10023192_87300 [Amycolatopsis samaneae]
MIEVGRDNRPGGAVRVVMTTASRGSRPVASARLRHRAYAVGRTGEHAYARRGIRGRPENRWPGGVPRGEDAAMPIERHSTPRPGAHSPAMMSVSVIPGP